MIYCSHKLLTQVFNRSILPTLHYIPTHTLYECILFTVLTFDTWSSFITGASSSSTVGFVSNFIKSTFKSNDETGDRKASVTSDHGSGEQLISFTLSPPPSTCLSLHNDDANDSFSIALSLIHRSNYSNSRHAYPLHLLTRTEEPPTSSPKGFVSNIFKNPFKSSGDKDSERKDSTSSMTESNKGQYTESYGCVYN